MESKSNILGLELEYRVHWKPNNPQNLLIILDTSVHHLDSAILVSHQSLGKNQIGFHLKGTGKVQIRYSMERAYNLHNEGNGKTSALSWTIEMKPTLQDFMTAIDPSNLLIDYASLGTAT